MFLNACHETGSEMKLSPFDLTHNNGLVNTSTSSIFSTSQVKNRIMLILGLPLHQRSGRICLVDESEKSVSSAPLSFFLEQGFLQRL